MDKRNRWLQSWKVGGGGQRLPLHLSLSVQRRRATFRPKDVEALHFVDFFFLFSRRKKREQTEYLTKEEVRKWADNFCPPFLHSLISILVSLSDSWRSLFCSLIHLHYTAEYRLLLSVCVCVGRLYPTNFVQSHERNQWKLTKKRRKKSHPAYSTSSAAPIPFGYWFVFTGAFKSASIETLITIVFRISVEFLKKERELEDVESHPVVDTFQLTCRLPKSPFFELKKDKPIETEICFIDPSSIYTTAMLTCLFDCNPLIESEQMSSHELK